MLEEKTSRSFFNKVAIKTWKVDSFSTNRYPSVFRLLNSLLKCMNSFVSAIKKISISLVFSSLASLALAYEATPIRTVSVEDLPKEAQTTLANIKKGGPFLYEKDGSVFGNYERMLPQQKRGYYREYTVKTPRARNRGARRIIAGGEPKLTDEFYYTEDHYASFRKIKN